MTNLSDVPWDVVEDNILSRVSLTCLKPVRATCKDWYNSSKNQIFGNKAAARKQFLGFVTIRSMVFSMVFDLQGIRNDDDFVDPSVSQLTKVKTSHVFHCDGLLLCVTKDHSMLLVWNPYLGQRMCFRTTNKFSKIQAIDSYKYALGYDNNHIHKIFRLFLLNNGGRGIEIYDFNSNSWKDHDLTIDRDIWCNACEHVSLKGNTYFFAGNIKTEAYLLCLDFTAERFGPRLPLPLHSDGNDIATLSCIRDEKLGVLYQHYAPRVVEIWITTKIDPNDISWSKFLKVSMTSCPLNRFSRNCDVGNFFIDEEKKVLVVFDAYRYEPTEIANRNECTEIAYIVGEDGYFKSMNIEEAPKVRKPNEFGWYDYEDRDFKLFSYVPSLMQLQTKQTGKRKQRDF